MTWAAMLRAPRTNSHWRLESVLDRRALHTCPAARRASGASERKAVTEFLRTPSQFICCVGVVVDLGRFMRSPKSASTFSATDMLVVVLSLEG